MSWLRTVRASEAIGCLRSVEVDSENLVVVALDSGQAFAFEDRCSHDGAPLGGGWTDGESVVCARHGAMFDMASGQVKKGPALVPLETFPARIASDGWLEVDLDT